LPLLLPLLLLPLLLLELLSTALLLLSTALLLLLSTALLPLSTALLLLLPLELGLLPLELGLPLELLLLLLLLPPPLEHPRRASRIVHISSRKASETARVVTRRCHCSARLSSLVRLVSMPPTRYTSESTSSSSRRRACWTHEVGRRRAPAAVEVVRTRRS
jgi:hypothetical protein